MLNKKKKKKKKKKRLHYSSERRQTKTFFVPRQLENELSCNNLFENGVSALA
jgi:hypothetical protein